MTRRLLLFVRNTSDSETIPPESWCASGAVCRTGMPNTCAKCAFHAASKTATPMSSTGSRTRRKMVLFQVLNRWRQYRPTLLCLSHSSWEKKREMDEPSEISSWFKPGSVQYMSSHTVEDGCSPATPERAWRTYSSLDVLGRPHRRRPPARPPRPTRGSARARRKPPRARPAARPPARRVSRDARARPSQADAGNGRPHEPRDVWRSFSSSRHFPRPGGDAVRGGGARVGTAPPAPAGATSATAMSSSRLQR